MLNANEKKNMNSMIVGNEPLVISPPIEILYESLSVIINTI